MLLNLTENEFFFLREAFYGLEYAENVFAAWASSRIQLGELTTLFQTPYGWERTPLPNPHPTKENARNL